MLLVATAALFGAFSEAPQPSHGGKSKGAGGGKGGGKGKGKGVPLDPVVRAWGRQNLYDAQARLAQEHEERIDKLWQKPPSQRCPTKTSSAHAPSPRIYVHELPPHLLPPPLLLPPLLLPPLLPPLLPFSVMQASLRWH